MNESDDQVIIVMATFNGEAWLSKQIASIQGQSYSDWTLLISDDGSSDRTVDIIRQAALEDDRIHLLAERDGASGHVGNFEYLLENALGLGGEFFFLADQDDLWQPEKLELMLKAGRGSQGLPLAVFSDLEIIDADGRSGGGYLQSMGLEGEFDILSLLRQNPVTGCSMMVNKALLAIALPFPTRLENHDWWLGLCAAACGCLEFCPEKLVRYRQHSGNVVGAPNLSTQMFRLPSILARQKRVFESKVSAADVLLERMEDGGGPLSGDLRSFASEFRNVRGWSLPWRLLFSKYRPRSKRLRLVQLLAVSPLT